MWSVEPICALSHPNLVRIQTRLVAITTDVWEGQYAREYPTAKYKRIDSECQLFKIMKLTTFLKNTFSSIRKRGKQKRS
jgi:hypothetical protein